MFSTDAPREVPQSCICNVKQNMKFITPASVHACSAVRLRTARGGLVVVFARALPSADVTVRSTTGTTEGCHEARFLQRREDTDLKDISEHDEFDDGADGERPGTFGSGTATNKIDFILLSPALFARAKSGGIFRKGVWGGKNGTPFEHFDEITKASEAASDHAAIWAEIDV